MKRTFIVATVLTAPLLSATSPKPVPLRDGQQVILYGKLSVVPLGRLQFVVLETPHSYTAVMSGKAHNQHADKPIHELGLSGYNRYDQLYAHRGQAVSIVGTVVTDGASPYYLHNISVRATSIRLPNGTDLLGAPRARPLIAVDVGQYVAAVLLPADIAAPWRYMAHGQADTERQFLSCSSNGGGDVVNCFCGQGFRATAIDAASGNTRLQSDVLDGMAQTVVGENAHPEAVTITVTCSR